MFEAVQRVLGGCFQKGTPGAKVMDFWNSHQQQRFSSRNSDPSSATADDEHQRPPVFPEKPAAEQIDAAFGAFVKELDLSAEKEKALFRLSLDNKWLMICEHGMRKDRSTVYHSPDYFVNVLESLPHRQDWEAVFKDLEALRISLRTQSQSYVQRFIALDGVATMASTISKFVANAPRFDNSTAAVLGCLKVLLNSTDGREAAIRSKDVLTAVVRSVGLENVKSKVTALEILSGLCLHHTHGHKRVLSAVSEASTALLGERTRFQRLLFDLWRPYDELRDGLRVKTAILSFVNVLLKSGPAENSLEFRLHLRHELLLLGMQEIVDHLRDLENPVIDDHLDLFDMMREEDEQDLHSLCLSSSESETSSSLDYESPSSMVDVLTNRLSDSVALPHLISLLQHLMLLPGDRKHVHLWRLFDIILQQISLQSSMDGAVADAYEPLKNFDLDVVIDRLRVEADFERLEKEHLKLADDHERLKAAYERERTKVDELQLRLSASVDAVSPRSSTLSSISSESTSPSDPRPSDLDDITLALPSQTLSRIPPAPPLPPPPPIDLLKMTPDEILSAGGLSAGPRKNVPKPKVPLKSLNWERLSAAQVEGTIWSEMEDEKLYKLLDLAEIERNFAAGSKSDYESPDSVMGTLTRRMSRADNVISVIEPRRAQNCTILLSKLKLTNSQIRHAVLSLDEHGLLPRDMVEQMLKFIPTKEELSSIDEAMRGSSSMALLASADRFLLEMSRIPRYEQRLKCLHFLRTFKERIDDVTPLIQAVTRAAKLTSNSKRLKHFLSLILAVGNYLNYGKHNCNTHGFTLASLHRLQDVKNSTRPERNLLHFLLDTIEKQFPDLLRLKRDLASVYDAARVSRQDINQELSSLEKGLQFIQEEIIIQKNLTGDQAVRNDRLLPALVGFADVSMKDYVSLQSTHQDMKLSFHSCVKQFGADPLATSPDEFFGVLAKFLTHFADAHHHLWKEREHQEHVKRQTLTRAIFAKKSKSRKASTVQIDVGGGGLATKSAATTAALNRRPPDFEQLISALQSGELFSDDLRRLRSSFRGSPKRPDRRRRDSPPTPTGGNGEKRHQNVQNIIVDGNTRDR